jgi:hypothetical protein
MPGTKRADVEHFLREFKRIWNGTVIDRRNEDNDDTLALLGITPNQRADEVRKLTYKNYSRGPKPDHSGSSGDIWEFGTRVRKKEVYIKLKIYTIRGKKRSKCISFHIAKWPVRYQFH